MHSVEFGRMLGEATQWRKSGDDGRHWFARKIGSTMSNVSMHTPHDNVDLPQHRIGEEDAVAKHPAEAVPNQPADRADPRLNLHSHTYLWVQLEHEE